MCICIHLYYMYVYTYICAYHIHIYNYIYIRPSIRPHFSHFQLNLCMSQAVFLRCAEVWDIPTWAFPMAEIERLEARRRPSDLGSFKFASCVFKRWSSQNQFTYPLVTEHNHGKSPCSVGKSTINGHFQ